MERRATAGTCLVSQVKVAIRLQAGKAFAEGVTGPRRMRRPITVCSPILLTGQAPSGSPAEGVVLAATAEARRRARDHGSISHKTRR